MELALGVTPWWLVGIVSVGQPWKCGAKLESQMKVQPQLVGWLRLTCFGLGCWDYVLEVLTNNNLFIPIGSPSDPWFAAMILNI